MNNNDIRQALQELEPEEGEQIAKDYLRSIGRVVKVWSRDDIYGIAEQDPEFDALTEDEQSRVLDYAVEDTTFQNLEDATDQDWDAISQAVDAGMVRVQAERA